MNLSIRELNELIYSLGITAHHGMLVNKELNESLLEKLYGELNSKLSEEDDEDYLTIPSEDELSEKEEWLENRLSEDSFPHYVSNEEADEDYLLTLLQDEQRYEKSKTKPFDKSTSQCILDYVENTGASTYTELNEFYKFVTGGSNSFSHILKNLVIPYKNRLTRRYLSKNADGKYVVRIASIHNWVEKSY